MKQSRISGLLAVVTTLIMLGHALGMEQVADFYWRVPYYDSPMHFLGGVWVGLVVVAFWGRFFEPLNLNFRLGNALKLAGIVLTIGLFWEFFEFSLHLMHTQFNIGGYENMSLGDTLKDLVLDWLGALTAFASIAKRE